MIIWKKYLSYDNEYQLSINSKIKLISALMLDDESVLVVYVDSGKVFVDHIGLGFSKYVVLSTTEIPWGKSSEPIVNFERIDDAKDLLITIENEDVKNSYHFKPNSRLSKKANNSRH
ncbi:hypothetical protein P3T73_06925 [Kiritimatiellota bacterium B12222]|nr:hypothetical protein P3T73_06925 [Kiritimatiellota bacterium B12222]